jgi:hypothetical protein
LQVWLTTPSLASFLPTHGNVLKHDKLAGHVEQLAGELDTFFRTIEGVLVPTTGALRTVANASRHCPLYRGAAVAAVGY